MKKALLAITIYATSLTCMAQSVNSRLLFVRDSTLQAIIHADSLKIEHQYAEEARWQKLLSTEEYPAINAGKHSGVFPVSDVTEEPDPGMKYKLLFEAAQRNPDSLLNEPDHNLVEIARIINLHAASGIPLKNISVVVVVHSGALNSLRTNPSYQKRFKMDNPNLKLIKDLEKLGARFVACGQAMSFIDLKRNELLPEIKVSFTAQTVLTGYQLKGYVPKALRPDHK